MEYVQVMEFGYHFEVQCSACKMTEKSETSCRHFLPGPSHPAYANDVKAFRKHLAQRGWHVGPPLLCKKCLDELVVEQVGAAFKDAIAAKAGEGR